MTSIEQQIKAAAEKSIIRIITEGAWIQPDYTNRLKMPSDLVEGVWKLIDRDTLMLRLKERVEAELADRIVNTIAAEIATDIKQVLGVPERREAIRSLAREHMKSLMAAGAPKP